MSTDRQMAELFAKVNELTAYTNASRARLDVVRRHLWQYATDEDPKGVLECALLMLERIAEDRQHACCFDAHDEHCVRYRS